ncbi:MAG: response regulator [Rhizobiales bacterium]|nr:response regulator [Hyphomicrobiales bacterium]
MTAAAQLKTPAEAQDRARRVLVAEDNTVTNDLLRLLLSERGHQVDIVEDGEEALAALKKHHYDVVLMDFHLPKMDGAEVANLYRSRQGNEPSPRIIAITSDMKGLLNNARDCETFDELLPKPLNLDSICKVIEGEATEISVSPSAPVANGLRTPANAPATTPSTSIISSLGYNFLHWPDDFDGTRLSARGLQASLGDDHFDAVLVCEPPAEGDLVAIWRSKSLHVLPVIDLTGTLGERADLDASQPGNATAQTVEQLITGYQGRRARLHPDLLFSDDIEDKLLARMFASGRDLEPRHDAGQLSLFAYNTVIGNNEVREAAERLEQRGLLAGKFFDRAHVCDRCSSSRFNVRETCAHCRSADLGEEAYLHHFKCAHQGPESDYRQGDDLVCPKCRLELSHFSVDYDKPGSILKCNGCGKAEFDAVVGFRCLDCEAEFTGDTVRTIDIESYHLTDAGEAYATAGRAGLGTARQVLRFAEMPIGLVVALNTELKRFNENAKPFTLVEISYRNENQICQEAGARQFDEARKLFLENLRNGLRDKDQVFQGRAFDFAFLPGVESTEAYSALESVQAEASELLTHDLGIETRVYRAEEFK